MHPSDSPSALRVELDQAKCQSYGKCEQTAPDVFRLGEDGKVELVRSDVRTDDAVLAAARGCPYRVITVFEEPGGEQLFPVVRKP